MELIKKLIDLYNEYGDEFVTLFNGVKELFKVEEIARRTHCEHGAMEGNRCGEECDAYVIEVGGKKVYRGKCPIHGFKR